MLLTSNQIAEMLEMLPEEERDFACEVLYKLVLAWDPDYTKLTISEEKRIEKARQRAAAGQYFKAGEIDWNSLDSMDLN